MQHRFGIGPNSDGPRGDLGAIREVAVIGFFVNEESRTYTCGCGVQFESKTRQVLRCPQCRKIFEALSKRAKVLARRAALTGKALEELRQREKAKRGGR